LALTVAVVACGGSPPPGALPPSAARVTEPSRGMLRRAAAEARAHPEVARLLPADWPARELRFLSGGRPNDAFGEVRDLCAALPDHGLDAVAAPGPILDQALRENVDRWGAAKLEVATHRVLLQVLSAVGVEPAAGFQALAQTGPQALLTAALPAHPLYQRLVDAHARYRGLVANGDLLRVPLDLPPPGGRGPAVEVLRARLAQEGYPAGPPNGRFDGALVDALLAFQVAHRLEPLPAVDNPTRGALGIPASAKVRVLKAALDAWRAAPRRPPYHLRVNLPDFHVELWDGETRLLRTPVIVGKVEGNATPVLASKVEQIVLNPFWYVPARIAREEYAPQDGADPMELTEHYRRQGFEFMEASGDGAWLRQPPGPTNPLGRVKFIFPNPFHVYLHDTPHTGLFARPVRAFSHGCVRVSEPMALAKLMAARDPGGRGVSLDALLARRTEQRLELARPVPVYIDHVPVRVDDDGRLHMLPDLYRRGVRLGGTR
jgi:L,D-transpeptidase YcbB